ncbi:MAG: helix-turn-helix transcriptional regulator [Planctomycetia bacterium]|nr:helix-turn-helix transcriptional regulator [Planctomycetia bacterium]
MSKVALTQSMSNVLRRAIRDCGLPLLRLQHATGVTRQRIMHFERGTQSLQLRNAEKLAAFLGLKLVASPGAGGDARQWRRPEDHPAELLLLAKKLVDQVGGIDRARAVIDLVEKLQKA